MSPTVTHTEANVRNFVEALRQLTDDRDNRGKRHELAFVVAAVVCAILNGRSKVSSIFRYLRNRIEWLREVTHHPEAGVVSRAHLPRLLARVDWVEVNTLIDQHFGVQVELRATHGWVAIDGHGFLIKILPASATPQTCWGSQRSLRALPENSSR